MQLVYAGQTDIGAKRKKNQDSFALLPEYMLFIVADGMGGHLGGEVASQLTIDVIKKYFSENISTVEKTGPVQFLKNAIQEANKIVYDTGKTDPTLEGMGTTTTALFFYKHKLFIGHVGDSRCYFIQPTGLWQLTRDHSLVQEKLRAGIIQRHELKTDQTKNVITRSVGFESHVEVDVYEKEFKLNDLFLICSDGLSGLVDDKQLLEISQSTIFNETQNVRYAALENATQELIKAANTNGGDDNITAILVQVTAN